jgi:hypothetical protein
MKPDTSALAIGVFPHHLLDGPRCCGHLGGRFRAGDYLDESVLRGVVEVVQADHALGMNHSAREIGDEK